MHNKIQKVYKEAGVPAGVFNVVLGGGEVGEMMVNDERVAKVSFTGSAATGFFFFFNFFFFFFFVTIFLNLILFFSSQEPRSMKWPPEA